MEFSTAFVRREALDSQRQHDRMMGTMGRLLSRLFGGDSGESPVARADFALGGFNRRRFLQIGGVSVATAAVVAACGTDDETSGGAADAGATSTTARAAQGDLTILRTASSIEHLAVKVYQTAIDSMLVKTAAVGDAAKLFQGQHAEHAKLFEAATTKAGGTPFTEPNPVLLQSLNPAIKALADERGVVALAFELERAAAATYQASVGTFVDKDLNATVMSVGGVEARHMAVLAAVLNQPAVPVAFQTRDGAVPSGTGV